MFHRVRDCFAPMVDRIAWAIEASIDAGNPVVCVTAQKRVLWPFLQPLESETFVLTETPPDTHEHYNSNTRSCNGRCAARITSNSYLSVRRIDDSLRRYKVALTASFRAPRENMVDYNNVVLVRRMATPRKLSNTIHEALRGHLANLHTRPRVRVYCGNDSVKETVNMFWSASAIVGIHGAGLANSIFCARATVHEVASAPPGPITLAKVPSLATCAANGSCVNGPWRTNGFHLSRFNPGLQWVVHVTPFSQMLAANNITHVDVSKANEWTVGNDPRNFGPGHWFMRTLSYVRLTDWQVKKLATRVEVCLRALGTKDSLGVLFEDLPTRGV